MRITSFITQNKQKTDKTNNKYLGRFGIRNDSRFSPNIYQEFRKEADSSLPSL
jgi:hypothetical protein